MAKLNSGTRIYGTATVDSTLAVTGATTLSSTLAVGATTITGAATVSTTLGVTGAATLSSTLAVTGIASFAAGSAAAPAITRTGDLDTGVWFPAANALGLSTSGTNAVYIDSGQKVGIGTSTPAVKLDVGYVAGDVALRVSRDANSRLDFYQGGGVSYIDSSPAGGVLAFATVGTERARIDASGNLGLGVTPSTYLSTTLPTLQLSTRSTLTADVNSTYLSCNNSGANDIYMGNSNYALKYHQDSAIGLHKWLNAPVGTAGNAITFTQAMTLDSSGKLLLGTTTAYGTSRLVLIPATSPTTASSSAIQLSIGEDSNNTGYSLKIGYINEATSSWSGSIQAIAGGNPAPLLLNRDGGNVLVGVGLLGYGTGAGGTVTQATNKGTAVTLNKPTGQITTNNAALAGGATVSFTVNNSLCSAVDLVLVVVGNGSSYTVQPAFVGAGNFNIRITNTTGGSLSEAVQINFAIIKGASA